MNFINSLQCYFKVKAMPVKAVIDGGKMRKVIKDFGFTISTTRSYDPNMPPNEQNTLITLWTCECLTKHIPGCENTGLLNKHKPFNWLKGMSNRLMHTLWNRAIDHDMLFWLQ